MLAVVLVRDENQAVLYGVSVYVERKHLIYCCCGVEEAQLKMSHKRRLELGDDPYREEIRREAANSFLDS